VIKDVLGLEMDSLRFLEHFKVFLDEIC
jgi:hypothetical protein